MKRGRGELQRSREKSEEDEVGELKTIKGCFKCNIYGENDMVNGNKDGMVSTNSLGADELNGSVNGNIGKVSVSTGTPEVFTPHNDNANLNENVGINVVHVDINDNVEFIEGE
ncbi:hypothetical protein V6N11_082455 [Hibiscus sabdariffa]